MWVIDCTEYIHMNRKHMYMYHLSTVRCVSVRWTYMRIYVSHRHILFSWHQSLYKLDSTSTVCISVAHTIHVYIHIHVYTSLTISCAYYPVYSHETKPQNFAHTNFYPLVRGDIASKDDASIGNASGQSV